MEAKVVFPECKKLLSKFTGKRWSAPPKYYIEEVLKEADRDIQSSDSEKLLLEKLFEFGFLGAVIPKTIQPPGGQAREKVFWYDNRILDIMQAEFLIVHRAFHKKVALGTAEDPLGEWV